MAKWFNQHSSIFLYFAHVLHQPFGGYIRPSNVLIKCLQCIQSPHWSPSLNPLHHINKTRKGLMLPVPYPYLKYEGKNTKNQASYQCHLHFMATISEEPSSIKVSLAHLPSCLLGLFVFASRWDASEFLSQHGCGPCQVITMRKLRVLEELH